MIFVFLKCLPLIRLGCKIPELLDADIKVRARRITQERKAESYEKPYEAMLTMKQREATNRERWIRYYDYDYHYHILRIVI